MLYKTVNAILMETGYLHFRGRVAFGFDDIGSNSYTGIVQQRGNIIVFQVRKICKISLFFKFFAALIFYLYINTACFLHLQPPFYCEIVH